MYRRYCIDITSELRKSNVLLIGIELAKLEALRIAVSLNSNVKYRAHLWRYHQTNAQ